MLSQLYKISSTDQAQLLTDQLEIAESFLQRGKGLLGRRDLPEGQALWIKPCNNIHTFFMKFSIDCLFLDKNLKIKKIYSHLKPFRIAGPIWKATSVVELKAGSVDRWNLSIGDQLYVVS